MISYSVSHTLIICFDIGVPPSMHSILLLYLKNSCPNVFHEKKNARTGAKSYSLPPNA